MYVIFPLDELLDLHSAKENKRGRATLSTPSHTRHTEEVLPLSQPNQLLPNQLKPPLNKQPKTILQQPTPTQQQKAPPTPPQKQPLPPSQKPSLSRAPSKTSIIVTSPSITVPSQSFVSVTSSNQAANVKKSLTPQPQQQQQTTTTTTTTTSSTTTAQLPPDPVTQRQRSSHSTSTETSSNSSTGAKGKALLSPQASGGPATNRASWAGSTTAVGFQESCPSRQGSFRASKDLTVSTEGNSLKVVEQKRSESAQDIAGSSHRARPPLLKSNSFRSHLSDTCALRPRNTSLEKLKKAQATGATVPTPSKQPSKQPSPSSETAKKKQEIAEKSSVLHPAQGNKTAEVTVPKPEIHQQGPKERQGVGVEGVKIKQEVPVQAAPPPPPPLSHHQITTAESLRIQKECLPVVSDPKALPANQRHPSGRSNRSGSQKLSDLPPSGSGGGARGAAGSSANPKTHGVLGSPRGLQQKNTVMASNEATFRDLTNPSHNESLKAHNAFTFKLVKTDVDDRTCSSLPHDLSQPQGSRISTAVALPFFWSTRREPIAGRDFGPSGCG